MNDALGPLVSVVMPTYNHAQYIGRAIQSVLDQTYKNWELIVIDNHSTDNTVELLAGFSDSRITYLKIHNNGVIALSRNVGIREAKGEWIAFLDSDDWWSSDKLNICCSNIRSNVDLLYHDLIIEKEDQTSSESKMLIESRQLKSPVLLDLLVSGNLLANSAVIVRKRLLEQVGLIDENPLMIACEDYNTWLKIAEISEGFLYVNQKLGTYMLHKKGMSNRNMMPPLRCAVSKFTHFYSKKEKRFFDCITAYESGKYSHEHNDYCNAIMNFYFCIKNASLTLRVKSTIRLIYSLVAHLKNG